MNEQIPDDCTEPTGLVHINEIRRAIDSLPDDVLASGDPEQIREAVAKSLARTEWKASWCQGLTGAGLDSPAGRRVLSAVRHVLCVLDYRAIANNLIQARNVDVAVSLLANSLCRIERDAAAEVDNVTPDLLDIYQLPSGALWAIPRDPYGHPFFWERESGRLASDPRASRDWALANLGQVCGSGWRKARVGSAETIPEAEQICRKQPGGGDLFERSLEAEYDE